MTTISFRRIGAFAAVSFLTLTILTACAGGNDQASAEAYIRANVADLSPTPAVLGGTFQVTDIEWEDSDTAVVSYEDGHIALKGRTNIVKADGETKASAFVIVEDYGYDGSASGSTVTGTGASASSVPRPLAKEGETCGGIAAIQCEPHLMCRFEGAYPDAAGTCVK